MRTNQYKVMYEVEENHFWYKGMQKISENLLHLYLRKLAKLKILDAGCGTGGSLLFLRKFGTVTGIDTSPLAIRFCKKRGLKNVFVGSVEKLHFKDNSFDIVTCFDVIPHQNVKDDNRAFSELYRVLKPGGTLLLRVAAYNWLFGYHDVAVQNKQRYARKEVKELLEKASFKPLKITYVNFFLFPVAVLRRFLSGFSFKKSHDSDVLPVSPRLNFILQFPLNIESFLIRYLNLPFGLSIVSVAQK